MLHQLDRAGLDQRPAAAVRFEQQRHDLCVRREVLGGQDQVYVGQLVDGDRLGFGQVAAGADHGAEREATHRDLPQLGPTLDMEAEAEMRIAVENGLRNLAGFHDRDPHRHPRMARPHQIERVRDQVVTETLDRRDLDVARVHPAQGVELRLHALGIGEHRIHMPGEDFAGRGQLEARRRPLEQLHPQARLEIEDLPVHGGRGDVQDGGGAANGAGVPHGIEVVNGGGVDSIAGGHGGGVSDLNAGSARGRFKLGFRRARLHDRRPAYNPVLTSVLEPGVCANGLSRR